MGAGWPWTHHGTKDKPSAIPLINPPPPRAQPEENQIPPPPLLDVLVAQQIVADVHDVADGGVGDDAEHIQLVVEGHADPAGTGPRLRGEAGDVLAAGVKVLHLPAPPQAVEPCVVEVEERVSASSAGEEVGIKRGRGGLPPGDETGSDISPPTPAWPPRCGRASRHGQALAKSGSQRHSSTNSVALFLLRKSSMLRRMQWSVLRKPGPVWSWWSPSVSNLSAWGGKGGGGGEGYGVVRERAVLNAAIAAASVAAEAELVVEDPRLREAAGIFLLVPVRLRAGVSALLAQQALVRVHVQAVEGQEPAGVVDDGGLQLVRLDEVVEAAHRGGQVRPLPVPPHQTQFGVEVLALLRPAQRLPVGRGKRQHGASLGRGNT